MTTADNNANISPYDTLRFTVSSSSSAARFDDGVMTSSGRTTVGEEAADTSLLLDNNYTGSSVITAASGNSTTLLESFVSKISATTTIDFVSGFHGFGIYTSFSSPSSSASSSYVSTTRLQTTSHDDTRPWIDLDLHDGHVTVSPPSGYFYAAGIVVGALTVLFILSAVALLVCRRRLLLAAYSSSAYRSLPSEGDVATSTPAGCHYDYLYRPMRKTGSHLSEDYEHTFVGVSIPLLQEVTIV